MDDRALSETAMLAGLRDIRLPAEAAGGLLADVTATVALACMAALACAALLRLFGQRQKTHRPAPLADHVAALKNLPEADRRVALLHMLKRHAPERFATLQNSLYRPGNHISVADLQREVERCA